MTIKGGEVQRPPLMWNTWVMREEGIAAAMESWSRCARICSGSEALRWWRCSFQRQMADYRAIGMREPAFDPPLAPHLRLRALPAPCLISVPSLTPAAPDFLSIRVQLPRPGRPP
jgi:hypothetical protein